MDSRQLEDLARQSVLVSSRTLQVSDAEIVRGPPLSVGGTITLSLSAVYDNQRQMGFQASNFGRAVEELSAMLSNRNDPDKHCTTFVGVTADILADPSCRAALAFMASHKLMDAVVVSGGAIEGDLRHTLRSFTSSEAGSGGSISSSNTGDEYRLGACGATDPALDGDAPLCCTEHFLEFVAGRVAASDYVPDADSTRRTDVANAVTVTPSYFWKRVGEELVTRMSQQEGAEEDGQQQQQPARIRSSFVAQCSLNSIPIYCPSFTDGDIFVVLRRLNVRQRQTGTGRRLIVDLVKDISGVNRLALKAKRSGMIILGGGVIKHHVCNANLMRNGADHCVIVSTAQEFDGSDAGARPDEAISWGKIKLEAKPAKIYADATLVFPQLVAAACVPAVVNARVSEQEGKTDPKGEGETEKVPESV